ncbi:MAG: pyruvate kinase [Clostridia bacterium]|nr:pyruvate kinase [Clostridia bacterium]
MSCKTMMKKTKIICSIGPSSTPPEIMSQMVEAGMNVARINFSHATPEEKIAVVSSVHKVREMTGKNIAILYDTKGPEFRNGMVEGDGINLVEGKTIRIVKESVVGNEERFSVNHPQAIDNLDVGSIVLLENGLMKIQVISVEDDGVTCKIINGGVLGNKKSLNAPGVKLDIPFVSDIDREDIIYACEHEGDYIALSFVSCKEDVLEARKILKEYNREDMKVISKIESTTGVQNLDEIIDVSDGIMVARGDLGVEVPMQQLPKYQKLMIQRCREKGKFVIVATEMLESMKKSARPTRAEVSDVANAVLDGTDAVMLSGETTVGKFPIEVVKFMAQICKDTEEYYDYDYEFDSEREIDITETIANSVVNAVSVLGIDLIIASTVSGDTARKISNLKPRCSILAATNSEAIARSLALNYAVYPTIVPSSESTDEVIATAKEKAKEIMGVKEGDIIAITGGFPKNGAKTTNLLKIEQL